MITLDELKAMNDAKFNRAIAELAGYHCEFGDTPVGIFPHRTNVYKFVSPGGKYMGVSGASKFDAWAYANHAGSYPKYSTDLNAAWGLWPACEPHALWLVATDETCYICAASGLANIERHAHPARALATAWAAWKLAQEASSDER